MAAVATGIPEFAAACESARTYGRTKVFSSVKMKRRQMICWRRMAAVDDIS